MNNSMPNIPQAFRRPVTNIVIPADTAGTGFYRFLQPIYTMWSGPENLPVVEIKRLPSGNANDYQNVDSVMVQRLIDKNWLQYMKFLKKISEVNGMRIIYNIDDAMGSDDIPKWNRGRRAYLSQETQDNIKEMLNMADEVLVTTEYIKTYYNRKYDVPLDNIVCIPNLLPRWWIDGRLDIDKKVETFKKRKSSGKIRVGVVSSLSHFNVDNLREKDGKVVFGDVKPDQTVEYRDEDGKIIDNLEAVRLPLVKDEMDAVADAVKSTLGSIDWVFVGSVPAGLRELANEKKIAVVPPCPILNYPQMVQSLDLDAWVVPCDPSLEFNKCKSNIKWLEACALGVVAFAQRVKPTYTKYMPDGQLWDDGKELKEKLLDMSKWSTERFRKTIEDQRKYIDTPIKECGLELKNWWLEDNINVWARIWAVPQKMTEAKKKFIEEMSRPKEIKEEDIVFKSEDGECMIVK